MSDSRWQELSQPLGAQPVFVNSADWGLVHSPPPLLGLGAPRLRSSPGVEVVPPGRVNIHWSAHPSRVAPCRQVSCPSQTQARQVVVQVVLGGPAHCQTGRLPSGRHVHMCASCLKYGHGARQCRAPQKR